VIEPPVSENELLSRAHAICGNTLQQIANQNNMSIPENLDSHKGWVGELIEICLGASAGSLPEPDFQLINVELKTIPINNKGKPRESTYVCTVPLIEHHAADWEASLVKKKLSRVLWVPVESEPSIPLSARRIGTSILWSPTTDEEKTLRSDWEELMEMIIMGELNKITAYHGQYLQIRPKAANAKSLRPGFDENGIKIMTLPRGFYLRTCFTQKIMKPITV